MARFVIVDLKNLYTRAIKAAGPKVNAFDKAGFGLHIAFQSMNRLYRDFRIDHIVICGEGRSWRYDIFPEYKANRRLLRASMTAAERDEDAIINDTFNEFTDFLRDKTRMTVLAGGRGEGDDYIARFVQLHRHDEHIILSSDSDFIQLLAPNVRIYDAMMERIVTVDGVTNLAGEPLYFYLDGGSGKLKVGDPVPLARHKHEEAEKMKVKDAVKKGKKKPYEPKPFEFEVKPNWWREALFIKLIRGDSGDGVFSAYPRVLYKGSKDKIGIREAWGDSVEKGYAWNNFMQSTWDKLVGSTPDGEPLSQKVTVRESYEFNEVLIDLTKQPEDVLAALDEVIVGQLVKEPKPTLAFDFLKFCGKHNLPKLGGEVGAHALYMNAPYPTGDLG